MVSSNAPQLFHLLYFFNFSSLLYSFQDFFTSLVKLIPIIFYCFCYLKKTMVSMNLSFREVCYSKLTLIFYLELISYLIEFFSYFLYKIRLQENSLPSWSQFGYAYFFSLLIFAHMARNFWYYAEQRYDVSFEFVIYGIYCVEAFFFRI